MAAVLGCVPEDEAPVAHLGTLDGDRRRSRRSDDLFRHQFVCVFLFAGLGRLRHSPLLFVYWPSDVTLLASDVIR